jgi:hypothetical protein
VIENVAEGLEGAGSLEAEPVEEEDEDENTDRAGIRGVITSTMKLISDISPCLG